MNTPIVFAPGVISLEGRFERVPAFSPDGKEFFFTVTTTTWTPTIMYSKHENGRWSEPDTAFFAKVYNNTDPFFSPDGQKLYFASTRPPGSPPWNTDILTFLKCFLIFVISFNRESAGPRCGNGNCNAERAYFPGGNMMIYVEQLNQT